MNASADGTGSAVVLPGEKICLAEGFIYGHGTILRQDNSHSAGMANIHSTYMGTVDKINKLVAVKPCNKFRHGPEIGDILIGRIAQICNKKWYVDTNSKYETSLSLSAIELPGIMQRKKSENDEINMREFFDIGDLVVCEVQKVAKSGTVSLHTRNSKYRKLRGGLLFRGSPMNFHSQKQRFLSFGSVECIVASNGYVWIENVLQEGGDSSQRDGLEVICRIYDALLKISPLQFVNAMELISSVVGS